MKNGDKGFNANHACVFFSVQILKIAKGYGRMFIGNLTKCACTILCTQWPIGHQLSLNYAL